MRFALSLLLAVVPAPVLAQNITGGHKFEMSDGAANVIQELRCASETSCIFSVASRTADKPWETLEKQTLRVTPLEDLREASGALRYAVERKDVEVRHNREYVEIMKQLRPILQREPAIRKCWDLNYVQPTYLVACAVQQKGSGEGSIFLFATLMASCAEAFCRYIIFPMQP